MMQKLPKCYNKFSKRQLKTQLLKQMNDNILVVWEIHDLNQLLHSEKQKNKISTSLNVLQKKELDQTKTHLQSAEKALIYKEKVIDKYKKLLHISVEDL